MTGQTGNGIHAIRESRPGFYEVASRLTGEVHEVKVNRGRFVGRCSCGAEASVPWAACDHQAAVRQHLMARWFRPRAQCTRQPG